MIRIMFKYIPIQVISSNFSKIDFFFNAHWARHFDNFPIHVSIFIMCDVRGQEYLNSSKISSRDLQKCIKFSFDWEETLRLPRRCIKAQKICMEKDLYPPLSKHLHYYKLLNLRYPLQCAWKSFRNFLYLIHLPGNRVP